MAFPSFSIPIVDVKLPPRTLVRMGTRRKALANKRLVSKRKAWLADATDDTYWKNQEIVENAGRRWCGASVALGSDGLARPG